MSEGQWIESATLDLWEGRHREQLKGIKELEARIEELTELCALEYQRAWLLETQKNIAEEKLAQQDALWEGMERALEESDAREETLNARITMLEEHLCLTEEKLAQQDDLVQAAVVVRDAQKAYFKDRSRDNLIASKQAEAALDKMLAAIREGGE